MESLAVEKAFLGCVVADPTLLDRTNLEGEDFGSGQTRTVFEAMSALHDRNEPANDWLCLENEIGPELDGWGGIATITSWTFETDVGWVNLTNGPDYARLIIEHADRRRLAAGLTEAAKRGLSGKLAMDEAVAAVEAAASYRDRGNPAGVAEVANRVWANAEEYHKEPLAAGKVRGLDTGWGDVNRVTGGWRPGLYVVLAVPHLGKSWFVLHATAAACERGKHAIVFPLEMGSVDLVTRLCTAAARVMPRDYEAGRMSPEEYGRFSGRAAEISEWRLDIDDRSSNLARVQTAIRRAHRKEPLDLVVIDPLGLLASGREETRNMQLGAVTRALKLLSRETGVPILVPHHVSDKEVSRRNNKRPKLSDGYESGHIGQDADVVLGLHREGFHDPRCERPNVLEVAVLKDRLGGQTGSRVQLVFSPYGEMLPCEAFAKEPSYWWHDS